MAIQRRISKSKYVLAGVMTFMIFSLGLTLGIILDNYRLKWADREIKKQEMEYSSLQFQYLYISTLKAGNESCAVLSTALEKSTAQLGESLDRFLEYEKQTNINNGDYQIIRRQYLNDNLRYWFFARRAEELCDLDKVSVLYFHSLDYCEICPRQGVILTYFKKVFDDRLLVFPINVDLESEESMITILRSRYNVSTYPTLIVEDRRFEGVVEKNELKGIICGAFSSTQPECS